MNNNPNNNVRGRHARPANSNQTDTRQAYSRQAYNPNNQTRQRPVSSNPRPANSRYAQQPGMTIPQVNQAYGARAGQYVNRAAMSPDEYGRIYAEKKKQAKKKRRRKIIAIVLAVILVLAAAGGAGAFFYINNLNKKMAVDDSIVALLDRNKSTAFYTLVIGSDNWEDNGAHADTMALVRADIPNGIITMVSIPRDTPYKIDGQTYKLNEVYSAQGAPGCIKAVSQVTGVPISHYVEVEFDELENVVDSLGGITVDVPKAIDYTVYTYDRPTVHIDAGKQLLNGEQAVALARMREAYTEADSQDAQRQANIRAMMVALVKKIITAPVNEIPGNVENVTSMLRTDLQVSNLVEYATSLAGAKNGVKMYTCTGPFNGTISDDPTANGKWLTYEAPEQWAKLMAVVDKGEDPTHVLDNTKNGNQDTSGATVIKND